MAVGNGFVMSVLGGFIYLIISFLLLQWWNPMLTFWGRLIIVIYFVVIMIGFSWEE